MQVNSYFEKASAIVALHPDKSRDQLVWIFETETNAPTDIAEYFISSALVDAFARERDRTYHDYSEDADDQQ